MVGRGAVWASGLALVAFIACGGRSSEHREAGGGESGEESSGGTATAGRSAGGNGTAGVTPLGGTAGTGFGGNGGAGIPRGGTAGVDTCSSQGGWIFTNGPQERLIIESAPFVRAIDAADP